MTFGTDRGVAVQLRNLRVPGSYSESFVTKYRILTFTCLSECNNATLTKEIFVKILIFDSYGKSNKMPQCSKILFHIYMKLNMFRSTHRPSSGA